MLTYKYTARDPKSGQKVTAFVQAENEKAAASLVQKEGLTPLSVAVVQESTGLGKFMHRIRMKDKILFSRQLSTLINAGLPLVQSLRSVNGHRSRAVFF
jgi:type IV pilus assembly protein PilC